jgi:hypothetical protein
MSKALIKENSMALKYLGFYGTGNLARDGFLVLTVEGWLFFFWCLRLITTYIKHFTEYIGGFSQFLIVKFVKIMEAKNHTASKKIYSREKGCCSKQVPLLKIKNSAF